MHGIATALIVLATGTAQAAGPEDRSRQKINIDAFWKYQRGDAFEAQAPAFNAAAWQAIDLPHSFSIPCFVSPDFHVGYGSYRER